MVKIKKIKTEPLCNKTELRFMRDRLCYYERVLNTDFLDEILSALITKRMLLNYLKKKGIDVNEIQKEYSKEIESVYMSIIPERYKKKKQEKKTFVRVINKKQVKAKK